MFTDLKKKNPFLCDFAKFQKAACNCVMSVRLPARPQGTTRLLTGQILIKFDILLLTFTYNIRVD